MNMGYRVLFPKVLIKELKKEIKPSVIVLDIDPEPSRGEVLSVGTPPTRTASNSGTLAALQKGDIVYYFPKNTTEITIEGVQLLLIEEENVLLIET